MSLYSDSAHGSRLVTSISAQWYRNHARRVNPKRGATQSFAAPSMRLSSLSQLYNNAKQANH